MIVKVTRSGNTFDLIDRVKRCSFRRDENGPSVFIDHDNGETESVLVTGSAYAMSDAGKTIDSFHK